VPLLQLQNTGRPEMAESGDVFWSHYIDEKDAFVSFWIWFKLF
jgi:hypothetical protein